MLGVELQKVANLELKRCKEMFSDFISDKFEAELLLSKKYKVNCCSDVSGDVVKWEVWHEEYPFKKRTVLRNSDTALLACSCLTTPSQGMPCRHVLTCLRATDEPLFQRAYFNARWQRRSDLPFAVGPELLHTPESCGECKMREHTACDTGVGFEGQESVAFDDVVTQQVATQPKKSSSGNLQQKSYKALRAACDNLIFFASHNHEVASIATNAIIHLEQTLRAGRIPQMQLIDSMFDISESSQLNQETINVAAPSTVNRNRGRKIKKRFISQGAGEVRAIAGPGRPPLKRKSSTFTEDSQTRVCKICKREGTCERSARKCTALAVFGRVLPKEEYGWLLSIDIPMISKVSAQDFNMLNFPKTSQFHHLVLEHVFKDGNGVKYCSVTALSPELAAEHQPKLFTFAALDNFMQTIARSNTCHICMRRDVEKGLIGNFMPPRVVADACSSTASAIPRIKVRMVNGCAVNMNA